MSEMITTRILKTLDASGLEINPEVFGKLLADDGELGDYFGNSVVASADGLTVVVGAPYVNDKGPDAGSAYIYTKQANGSYLQTQKLLVSDGEGEDYFGCSAAISADGTTIVVGAFSGGGGTGTVYVFTKQAKGSYLQTQKLLASDGTLGDYFGFTVATSADGSTVVIGAHCDDDKDIDSGSAYVFTKQANGSYLETQKLLATDGAAGDNFGVSIALSGDSLTIVVGAFSSGDEGNSSGSAYIFIKQTDGSYLQTQKLVAIDGATYDYFGFSVAVSGDGSTIVVGANGDDDKGASSGSVYIFTKQANGSYLETQKLTASDGTANDYFGCSAAISADGTTIVVGAFSGGGGGTGTVYVFTKQAKGSYLQTQKLVASDGVGDDYFGGSVAVSSTSVVIGAYNHLDKGAVYVY